MIKKGKELLFETTRSKVKMSLYLEVREVPSSTVTVNREKITTPPGYAHSVILKLNGKHFVQKSKFLSDPDASGDVRIALVQDVLKAAEKWADEGVKELKELAR